MSEKVGIRALQQNASAVVSRAANGEVIEITDRGRPVARLVPSGGGSLAALIASGMARPARRPIRDLPPPIAPKPKRPSLGVLLKEARESER